MASHKGEKQNKVYRTDDVVMTVGGGAFQKNDGCHSQELNKSNDKSCIDYSIFQVNGNISNLVNAGIINKNSKLYRQK